MIDGLNFDDYRSESGEMDWDRYYIDLQTLQEEKRRTHRDRLTKAFAQFGIVRAEIAFSGGNDQGGADSHAYFDKDGNQLDPSNFNYVYTNSYDHDTKQWVKKDLTQEEQDINAMLDIVEEPLQSRWGSWAGDFYVDGTLTYDLSDPNAESYTVLDFEEQVYEHNHEEF